MGNTKLTWYENFVHDFFNKENSKILIKFFGIVSKCISPIKLKLSVLTGINYVF